MLRYTAYEHKPLCAAEGCHGARDAIIHFRHRLNALKVATQEIQLNDLAAEVETRVRMEEEAKREHFAAEAKKTMLLNELKVRWQLRLSSITTSLKSAIIPLR